MCVISIGYKIGNPVLGMLSGIVGGAILAGAIIISIEIAEQNEIKKK